METRRALASLGEDEKAPALDAMADIASATQGLRAFTESAEEDASALLRVHPALGVAEEGYGPPPGEPSWLRIERGGRVGLAALRAGAATWGRAKGVFTASTKSPCCDAPACSLEREETIVGVELAIDGEPGPVRLLAAAPKSLAGSPDDRASAFARSLADALGVDAGASEAPTDEGAKLPAPEGAPLPAARAGRYAMRPEGDRIVLRDHEDLGPMATAGRNKKVAIVLFVLAAGLWYGAGQRISGGFQGQAIAFASIATLVSLTAYAFFGVARFSGRYKAGSAPLLAIGRDRFVVAPWVSRSGAIDLRAEGRLGAAIPLGEVREVSVKSRGEGRFAVEIDNDHGPIDAFVTEREEIAQTFARAIARAMDDARHPQSGTSAKQRARARANKPQ